MIEEIPIAGERVVALDLNWLCVLILIVAEQCHKHTHLFALKQYHPQHTQEQGIYIKNI